MSEPLTVQFWRVLAEGLENPTGPVRDTSRIERCRRVSVFCTTYLPHHFSEGYGEHHHDLFSVIERPNTGQRVVRAEPREHGKSTIMMVAATLYWLSYEYKRFILLIGAGGQTSSAHFLSMQSELDPVTGNELLLADFPHLKPKTDFKGQLVKWTDGKIKLDSGAVVQLATLYSGFRGLKEDQHRPDAIIMDDPQDEEAVQTAWRRNKAVARVRRTILNLGSQHCDIIIEGNLMHKESIVGTFLMDDNWDAKLYKAYNNPLRVDEPFPVGNRKTDGTPLWPQVWSRERLTAKQAEIGSHAFDMEFMNEQRARDDVIYDSSTFHRFRLKPGLRFRGYDVVVYWDPSTGKRPGLRSTGHSLDPCAIVVMASRKLGKRDNKSLMRYYWVLAATVERLSPEEQIDVALGYFKMFPATKLYYADTGGFAVLVPFLKRRAKELGLKVPVRPVQESGNKFQRIANDGMQMILKNRVFFSDDLPVTYFRQWDHFPDPAEHDDAPDATVGAIEQLEKSSRMF